MEHLRDGWRKLAGYQPAPANQVLWFHGGAASAVVRSQKLYGSGDFGDGGYVTNDPEWAREHGKIVVVEMDPRKPYYGGEGDDDRDALIDKLVREGYDVWFPDDRSTPSNPGSFAVILDSSCATFRLPRKGETESQYTPRRTA